MATIAVALALYGYSGVKDRLRSRTPYDGLSLVVLLSEAPDLAGLLAVVDTPREPIA